MTHLDSVSLGGILGMLLGVILLLLGYQVFIMVNTPRAEWGETFRSFHRHVTPFAFVVWAVFAAITWILIHLG